MVMKIVRKLNVIVKCYQKINEFDYLIIFYFKHLATNIMVVSNLQWLTFVDEKLGSLGKFIKINWSNMAPVVLL